MSNIKVAFDYGGVIHPEIDPTIPEHFKTRNLQRLRNKIGNKWKEKFDSLEDWEKHLKGLGEEWYQKRVREGQEYFLKALDLVGPENLYIISKANPKRQEETLQSLKDAGLLATSEGDVKLLREENIIFIPVTADKLLESKYQDKGQAAKEKKIDIMIDDDCRNLVSYKSQCRYGHCLHFVPFFEIYEYPFKTQEKCYMVSGWSQIISYLEDMIEDRKKRNHNRNHNRNRNNKPSRHPGRSFNFYEEDEDEKKERLEREERRDSRPQKRWTNRDGSTGGLGDDIPDQPYRNERNHDGRGRGRGRGGRGGGRGRGNGRGGSRGRGNGRGGGHSRGNGRGRGSYQNRDYQPQYQKETRTQPQPTDFDLGSLNDFPTL